MKNGWKFFRQALSARLPALCLLFGTLFATEANAADGPMLLVAGYHSDNVVQFDLTTGKWSEIARLPKDSLPRGIAVSDSGEIFLSLQGGKQNISKLVPSGGELTLRNLSPSFGRYGPGIITYAKNRIWAAGDTERVVFEINPVDGAVSAPPQFRNCCNIVGIAVHGNTLYSAEYFQSSVARLQLAKNQVEWKRFVVKDEHLSQPMGMAIGHNGNLYVANGKLPTVVEFNIETGQFVRTLIDIGAGGKEGIHSVVYSPDTKHYYLASGSNLYEVDTAGKLLATYNSPALQMAYGIALAPFPSGAATAKISSSTTASPGGPVALVSRPITTLRAVGGHLEVNGAPGEHYRVLATTDFQTWANIGTIDNPVGAAEFVDPDAEKFSMRFYKLELISAQK